MFKGNKSVTCRSTPVCGVRHDRCSLCRPVKPTRPKMTFSQPRVWSLIRITWLLLAFLGVSAACLAQGQDGTDTASGEALTTVSLALQWRPQSQFAGYYMAQAKGFYHDQGLRVELLHADGKHSALQLLRTGQVDLATAFLSDGLIAATDADTSSDSALAVVQVAQLVRNSNLMLIGWKDMGIEQAADLDGARVSYWMGGFWVGIFTATFDAFFDAHGVAPIRIPQHGSVDLFLAQGVAACSAMEYNEYHRIFQAGVDPERLTTFFMHDQGLGFAEDGIYTTASWFTQHPEVARAVREATLAGWAYARDHPEETVDVVMAKAHQAGRPVNRPLQTWMLAHIIDDIFPDETSTVPAGMLEPIAFERAARTLHAAGLLARVPALADFAPLDAVSPR